MAWNNELTSDQRCIRDRFVEDYGGWNEGFETLLRIDPKFMDAVRRYVTHPWRNGPLSRKNKALVHLAVDASPSVPHGEGIRLHVQNAFEYGATTAEVVEVIEITFVLGIHSLTLGVPILVEAAGLPEEFTPAERETHEQLKRAWEKRRGFWEDARYDRMVVDPGHFEHYLNVSAYPWENGTLDPKIRELVYVAIDASPTHMFESGLELHIENAIERGASREEILEALQIANGVGLRSIQEAMPIVLEEAERFGRL